MQSCEQTQGQNVYPKTFDEIILNMQTCEQMSGLNIYQHGQSVWHHYQQLLDNLNGYELNGEWRLPRWFKQFGSKIVNNLYSKDIMEKYTIFHDIGKPYCKIVDEKGQHFPDHANISADVWACVSDNKIVENLIRSDMDVHTLSAEKIKLKCENEWTVSQSCSLIVAALAEIHSNAKMFGGINSTGFKMKFSTVEKRGNQICKLYFP